jgi:hypothetical protein
MPRISEERQTDRRPSAWACFRVTGSKRSLDDVIAATGMTPSADYRYFRSKDAPADAEPDAAAALFTLMPGLVVTRHLAAPVSAERLDKGLAARSEGVGAEWTVDRTSSNRCLTDVRQRGAVGAP